MTTELSVKKSISMWKVKALVALTGAGGLLVTSVSAAGVDLSGVTDLVEDVTLIFPALVEVVIAAIPILIIIGVAAFVISLLDGILNKIK